MRERNLVCLEATRRLRRAGCGVPVIALSADATTECQRTSLEAGCDLHVSKPFDPEALVAAIQSLCEDSRAESRAG